MYKKVLKEAEALVTPSKEEEKKIKDEIKRFLSDINSRMKDARAELGGSQAKGSWLSGSSDIDIFIVFDYRKYKERSYMLSDLLEVWLKGIKYERVHGSRDYFQIKRKRFTFELVPVLGIRKKEEALNITDISLSHVRWIRKKSDKNMIREIRLTKAFLKGIRCYGAESYIGGFSGHAAELLTIYYGGFLALLKAGRSWRNKEVIDIAGLYKGKDPLKILNRSKLNSPIIVIDPTDNRRNAAAALRYSKFKLFKNKAEEFLDSPSVEFFKVHRKKMGELKKAAEGRHLLVIEAVPLDGKRDVIGAKLLKTFNFIKKKLSDFDPVDSDWEWNGRSTFYFIVKKEKRKGFEIRTGPSIDLKGHVKQFKLKHPANYIIDGKIAAKIRRKDNTLNSFAVSLLKERYLKDKVKSIIIKYVR